LTKLVEFNPSMELVESLLQSGSMSEVCRRFLFSDLNNFAHTIFVCSFDDDGLVKVLHAQGKQADSFSPPANIWEPTLLSQALRSNDYVLKSESNQTLHVLPLLQNNFAVGALLLIGEPGEMIGEVIQGQLRLVQLLGGYFLAMHGAKRSRGDNSQTPEGLSPRQLSILEHLCDSLTNAQIANRLHVSLSTVGQELMKIYRFLGVGNRNEACLAARAAAKLVTESTDHPQGLNH
jgi:DNA-binding CsgD family transcriptional regulator